MPKQADKYIFGYDNENEFKKYNLYTGGTFSG
mgnify:CR=1 FL=1